MRDLIKYILFAFVVVTVSCKKQKEATSEPQNTSYAANLTPQEQSLLGHWMLDSIATYNSTAWMSSYRPNSSMKLQGTSSADGCMSPDTAYSSYSFGTSYSTKWQWSSKQNNLLIFATTIADPCVFTDTIVSLTPSSLVLKVPGNSGQAPGLFHLNYYHK